MRHHPAFGVALSQSQFPGEEARRMRPKVGLQKCRTPSLKISFDSLRPFLSFPKFHRQLSKLKRYIEQSFVPSGADKQAGRGKTRRTPRPRSCCRAARGGKWMIYERLQVFPLVYPFIYSSLPLFSLCLYPTFYFESTF